MKKNIKPVFIFCLPRSGSTLLQRVLMSHSKISSMAEPHFLLPFIYASKKEGTLSKYSHLASQKGIDDVIRNLPKQQKEYNAYLRQFSLNIYDALAEDNSIYFLDKTPRYYSIIEDIEKIFPDAKFIFLYRNPVQIYASILTTFSNNRFHNIHGFYKNLTEGIELLSNGFKKIKAKSYRINYEDFVMHPEGNIKNLLNYLDLEYEDNILSLFQKQNIVGRSKDPTGIKMYKKVETTSIEKWKKIFNTRYRKQIIKKYIENLSSEALDIQGYDKQEILADIQSIRTNGKYSTIRDYIDFQKLRLIMRFKLNIFFSKNLKWAKGYYLN